MKARIVKTCTVVCDAGSIVEITQDQFLALGDAAVKVSESKTAKTPVSKSDTGKKE